MRVRFLSCITILSIFKLAQLSFALYGNSRTETLSDSIFAPKPICFAEQQFALGRRIDLSSADLFDLELIPGVSDVLANNIINKREQILAIEKDKIKKMNISPFELVHGVGKQTAKKLTKYLRLQ